MKRVFLLGVLLCAVFTMQAQKQIAYIKDDGSWYQVYDESGRKVTTMSKQTVGEVVGWGSDFFVALDGSWYKTYDMKGKNICTLSKQTVGTVVGVSGSTFTSKDGEWMKIYDKTGKKINTHSAQ